MIWVLELAQKAGSAFLVLFYFVFGLISAFDTGGILRVSSLIDYWC